jgi:hypothetical protein
MVRVTFSLSPLSNLPPNVRLVITEALVAHEILAVGALKSVDPAELALWAQMSNYLSEAIASAPDESLDIDWSIGGDGFDIGLDAGVSTETSQSLWGSVQYSQTLHTWTY